MAERPARLARLDQPRDPRRRNLFADTVRAPVLSQERFGIWSERFARFMGTAKFLIGMSIFVVVWLAWNTLAPQQWQFDPRELNYTLLTLILSLQASYAAPLAALRIALRETATRDFIRSELRDLLEELDERGTSPRS